MPIRNIGLNLRALLSFGIICLLLAGVGANAGRRQKLSATPDQSGTVNLCHIMNSALKNASRSSLA
ncbi:hypothetical protein, partial [Pseudomonas avellanae]|uniref:hypothetical protein n=1 Tax=Pseudomonas avellanae TaxID=46257 RepID=UPI0019D37BBC